MRNYLSKFFAAHEFGWEIFMMVLAVAFVVEGFIPDWIDLTAQQSDLLDVIDMGITVIFVLEFATRIIIAESKKYYLREHWLDLVAVTPAVRWLRFARVLRLLRLLRLARAVKFMKSLDRFEAMTVKFVSLNGLQWALLTLTGVMLTSSVVMFFAEHEVNPHIETYWDALYASLVAWMTPGYGDHRTEHAGRPRVRDNIDIVRADYLGHADCQPGLLLYAA